MAEALLHAIRSALNDAADLPAADALELAEASSAPDQEPLEAALEAAAWLLVLDQASWLDRLSDEDRRELLERTPIAIRLARTIALADVEERDSWLRCALLAEAGLARLRGETIDYEALPADALEPSPRRVRRALAAELDGFSAASCAIALAKRGSGELTWLAATVHETQARPYRFVADPEKPIRNPDEGQHIDSLDDLQLDIIWFETDRQLAFYAAEPAPLSVKGKHATTLDSKRGYWIGTFRCPLDAIEVELTLGDIKRTWRAPRPNNEA